MLDHLKTLKAKVLYTLEHFPATRNCDVQLTGMIWIKFYPEKVFKNDKDKWSIELGNLRNLPREDNVKRVRAIIQNVDHKFLPTNPEVARQRGISAELIRANINQI